MRSPWQLIKSLASRRKAEDVIESEDQVVPPPDPSGQRVSHDPAPQAGPDAAPGSTPAIPVDDNEASELPKPPEAEMSEPDPLVRADPLPPVHASDDASAPQEEPSSVAPVLPVAEPAPIAHASAEVSNEDHPHEVREQNGATATARKRSAKRPAAARKTPLDKAIDQDREINDLRSQLSAKLLEQNKQLRRMLERYSDK